MNAVGKEKTFDVTFWGTRGTLPAPGRQFARAGGNTNCIEVKCGGQTIVIDAGTGIRELGSQLAAEQPDQRVHMLLTHAHYDHVEGVPFFAPFFMQEKKVDIYCGELDGSTGTEDTVLNLMRRPYFPVGPTVFTANVSYNDLAGGEAFDLPEDIRVTTAELNHPGGATAYRIDYAGKSFACITDTEHKLNTRDENIMKLIDGVDLFVYDASLTDEEYPDFAGYGHSTYEEALRLQEASNAVSVAATHHMPFRVDTELDLIELKLKEQSEANMVAREGETINLVK